MIIDTTQTRTEKQMEDGRAPLPFFYGTTFYPQGAELPDDVIREVLLNGFHNGFPGFSLEPLIVQQGVQPSVVFAQWESNADPNCTYCFGSGYIWEAKGSKKYTRGEHSFRCECGMMHSFLLPLEGEEDEFVYCECGRYLCYLLQDGSMITEF